MPSIVRYQKVSDELTTYRMAEPRDADGNSLATELCTLDGLTYVAIADGAALPEQPPEITVETVTMNATLRSQIKAASPHCRLIADRMQEQIRSTYALEDELYIARISVGSLQGTYILEAGEDVLINDYQAFVESVREWGRTERAKLGL